MPERKHLLGGTDAASVLGMGRVSPVALYLRLTGAVQDDFEGNEATDAGKLFEEHVVVPAALKQNGLRLARPADMTLQLPDEPRIGASFDFEVAYGDDEKHSLSDRPLADAKLTGSKATWGADGERKVPLPIEAQMQQQMAVSRAAGRLRPCVHVLAMFIPGFVQEDFVVQEDRELGDMILAKQRELLDRVDRGDPPEPGSELEARALFLGVRGEVLNLTAEQFELLRDIEDEQRQAKTLEASVRGKRNQLIPELGTATELFFEGQQVATWRPNKVFDEELFCATHPNVVDHFLEAKLNRSALKKAHKQLYEVCQREPEDPQEQTRVLRPKKGAF